MKTKTKIDVRYYLELNEDEFDLLHEILSKSKVDGTKEFIEAFGTRESKFDTKLLPKNWSKLTNTSKVEQLVRLNAPKSVFPKLIDLSLSRIESYKVEARKKIAREETEKKFPNGDAKEFNFANLSKHKQIKQKTVSKNDIM